MYINYTDIILQALKSIPILTYSGQSEIHMDRILQRSNPKSLTGGDKVDYAIGLRSTLAQGCPLEFSDLEFFEKMEKNNTDINVTCKFNTYLEKAFFRFLNHSVRIQMFTKISKNAEFYADFRTVEKHLKKCTHTKVIRKPI